MTTVAGLADDTSTATFTDTRFTTPATPQPTQLGGVVRERRNPAYDAGDAPEAVA
jgi:hypothetical protein